MGPRHAALATLLLALSAPPALADGAGVQAGMGASIARQWCAHCHVVDGSAPASDALPSFAQIAADPARTDAWLRDWLAHPHGAMPDFSLTRHEIDALIAYIRTLAP